MFKVEEKLYEMTKIIMTVGSLKVNGVSGVILNYIKNMNMANLRIDLVCCLPVDENYKKDLEDLGIHVIVLPTRNQRPFSYYRKLFYIMKKGDYDIFHIHTNSCTSAIDLILAKWAGIRKRIAHSHNSSCTHIITHKLLYGLFEKNYTDGVACSELAGKWLFRNKPFVILNNGIDVQKFKFNERNRFEIRKEFNIESDTFVIGHVGLFSKIKNQAFLIDVFDKYHESNKNSKLLLVGDGVLLQEIKGKVSYLGLEDSVIFAGIRKDINKIYSAMDAFALPSYYEGLCLVGIEAQCNGLDCILSKNITKEVDQTGDVVFLPIDDIGPWISSFTGVVDHRNANASKILEKSRFNIKNEANRLRDIYLS